MDDLKVAIAQDDKDAIHEVLSRLRNVLDVVDKLAKEGIYLLQDVCARGYTDLLQYLIGQGIDLNQLARKELPVQTACLHNQVEVLKVLLRSGADLFPEDVQVWHEESPFYIASRKGNSEMVQMLITHRPSLLKDEAVRSCLLYAACLGGNVNVVKCWITPGTNLNHPLQYVQTLDNCDNKTPLYAACSGGHLEVVMCLLQSSTDLQLTAPVCNAFPQLIEKVVQRCFIPCQSDSTQTDGNDMEDEVFLPYCGHLKKKNLHCLHPLWLLPYAVTLVELDVSDNHLTTLPPSVPWQLQNLKHFTAMHNDIKCLGPPVGDDGGIHCNNLEEINLSYNQLESVSSDLFYIPSLKILTLAHNKLTYLVRSVHQQRIEYGANSNVPWPAAWTCQKLKQLNVSHNELELMPEGLRSCSGLVNLVVKHNRLTAFPQPWECKLATLDLSHNELERFPVNVEQYWCDSLRYINISHNKLDEINEGIVKLRMLVDLDANHNKIDRIPRPDVWECIHLHHLNLSHNKLGLPPECSPASPKGFSITKRLTKNRLSMIDDSRMIVFSQLLASGLKELRLSNNNLDCVPPSLCNLRQLEIVDLSDNPLIRTLPKELGHLRHCGMLNLSGLTLDNVPQEHCTSGQKGKRNMTREILAGFLRTLRKCEPYRKLKTVVLGKKDKGKTTLVNLLAGLSRTRVEQKSISRHPVRLQQRKGSFPILRSKKEMDIELTVWDIAGEESYSLIHHCVFTPYSLYLLVWDFWSIDKELDKIAHWLYNIQAGSPHFKAVLVGTFLDKFPMTGEDREYVIETLRRKLVSKFPGLKESLVLCPISCINKEGIDMLKTTMYELASSMRTPGRRGNEVVGRNVPKSYFLLEERIAEELQKRQSENRSSCLTQNEFSDIVEGLSTKDDDLDTSAERDTVTRFLMETGSLLHFSDQLGALNTLYFLDPAWLCDVLVHILISSKGQELLRDNKGKISRQDAVRLYTQDADRFPPQFVDQYIELLERFEIAASISNSNKLFFPSQLPAKPPMNDLAREPDNFCKMCRLYRMSECPSGFWTRLITRMMTRVEQLTMESWSLKPVLTQTMRRMTMRTLSKRGYDRGSMQGLQLHNATKTFCREWIFVQHEDGKFCVEPCIFNSDSLQKGVLITEINDKQNFGIMGVIVDEIEDIISDFYPGLLEMDEVSMTNNLERYALCSTCYQTFPIASNINHFTMEHCARMLSLDGNIINCPKGVKHNLDMLVPDLLMKELPKKFLLDTSQLEFQETSENCLGGGVSGTVFKGRYGNLPVAVKLYRSDVRNRLGPENSVGSNHKYDSGLSTSSTVNSVDNIYMNVSPPEDTLPEDPDEHDIYENFDNTQIDLDEADSIKAYRALREMRQEVALTSRLQHPCVISLVGIAFRPKLMMALELAPLGSLRTTLDGKMEGLPMMNKYKNKGQVQPAVFEKELTYKLVYQIAKGLSYLHSHGIIYKDLKSDNILVLSLDLKAPVNVKLSDYGISKYCWSGRSVGLVGTPGYQAPEILDGVAYDEKVDIFSFSMVIYEILTGRRPYMEYENMAQISKALRSEGKRPCIQEFNIHPQFPYLEHLMGECWRDKASDRPRADHIASKRCMQTAHFLTQNARFQMADKSSFPADCALGAATVDTDESKSKKPFVYVWEGAGEGRCLSILNLDQACFSLEKERFTGPRVTCVAVVGKHIWIGNVNFEVEVYGPGSAGNIIQQSTYEFEDRPVQILSALQRTTAEQEVFVVYVALADGHLVKFCTETRSGPTPSPRAGVKKLAGYVAENHIALRSTPVCCMTLTKENKELWVSNGAYIDIIDCVNSWKVRGDERINLEILNHTCRRSGAVFVSEMIVCNQHVLCVLKETALVIAFDVHSYRYTCVLDLRENSVYRKTVVTTSSLSEADHKAYRGSLVESPGSTQVSPSPDFDSRSSVVYRRKTEPSVYTDSDRESDTAPAPELPERMMHGPSMDRSGSSIVGDNGDIPPAVPPRHFTFHIPRRPPITKQASRSLPAQRLMRANDEFDVIVTSVACVGNSVWIGRSQGDICVIDLEKTSSDGAGSFGQVVAVLRDLGRQQRGVQSETGVRLVRAGRYMASAIILSGEDAQSRADVVSWDSYDADDFRRVEKYWYSIINIEKGLLPPGELVVQRDVTEIGKF